ncbi:hypothetical protein SCH4B_2966 [Ruegeria sp. TrichCH4B]|nr:hypothetical protein SCH4B_2966 [Ruegeria sp. TrichCH4B]
MRQVVHVTIHGSIRSPHQTPGMSHNEVRAAPPMVPEKSEISSKRRARRFDVS